MRALWIIGAGAEAIPIIQTAKQLGLRVIASDANPRAPGLAFCDQTFIVSAQDAEGTLQVFRSYQRTHGRVDGVLCGACDFPVTAATLTNDAGLPGQSLRTARLASDKLAMKRVLGEKGIPIPRFQAVHSTSDLRSILKGWRCSTILKPVDSRGARGVLRLQGVDLEWAFQYSRSQSPTGRVMIEEYLQGPQISTETILVDGRAVTPGFSDRNYQRLEEFHPFMIEDGGQQPSCLAKEQQTLSTRLAERAAQSLGISNGIAKGDLVFTDSGPKVIEVAARLSGGWFSTHQIPWATGVNVVEAAIRLALDDPVSVGQLTPKQLQGVAIRYFFPRPGRLTSISDPEEVQREEWLRFCHFFVGVNQRVEPVSDHTKRVGLLIATGPTRDIAVERAETALSKFELEVAPA